MKISPQDRPKAVVIVIGIVICVFLIGKTLMTAKKDSSAPESATFVAGNPVQTAALEPKADPMDYVRNVERWSQPPEAPAGDPFREVLPREVATQLRRRMDSRAPVSEISGNHFDGPGGLPVVTPAIDFPEVKVQGVVVDSSGGTPTNYAVLQMNNQVIYAKQGDVIGNALKVDKVTEVGVWFWAAKEHAFIEVDKSYKPNGMPPPAPPKPATSPRHSSRHRR